MVVAQDQCRSVVHQRPPHHLSRIDTRPIYRAPEQDLECQWPVLGIEKQTPEHLAGLMPEHGFQVASHRCRAVHGRLPLNRRCKVPAADLKQRLQLAVPHRAQPKLADEGLAVSLQQPAQAAELHQQASRKLHDITPTYA